MAIYPAAAIKEILYIVPGPEFVDLEMTYTCHLQGVIWVTEFWVEMPTKDT